MDHERSILGWLFVVAFALVALDESRASDPPARPSVEKEVVAGPKANAGDEAIGLVGRRVTLNGSESLPSDGLSYRWIQVDGPEVALNEAGRYCSFVPMAPGNYRFALVVAYQNRISLPDFVVVSVGTPPAQAPGALPLPMTGPGGQVVAPAMMPGMPTTATAPTPLDSAVALALSTLDDAPMVAGPLAEIFQAAALRMDLYQTYGEIFSEMSRRLDAVIPADPIRRGRWNTALFEPLTTQTVASMAPLGLDLRVPGSQEARLSRAQKQELRSMFERLAAKLAGPRAPR